MKYKITEVTQTEKNIITKFYNDHCDKDALIIKSFIDANRFSHLITIEYNSEIITILSIIKLEAEKDYGELTNNHYQLFHTVVHINYRNQGYCNAMLRIAVKLLIGIGADKIRVSKSSLNDVKHTIFTDMNFNLLKYQPEEIEYKHVYELDTNKVINMWSQYE